MSSAPQPPVVYLDSMTTFFFEGAKQRELRIMRCNDCGFYVHLPRPICRNCQSFSLSPSVVSGNATLYSYTITSKPFHPFFVDRVPYVVATVALIEQPELHLISNVVGIAIEDVKIGMALTVDFEDLSGDLTIPVFRPATSELPTGGSNDPQRAAS